MDPSLQMKRTLGEIFLQRSQLATRLLGGPLDQLLRLRSIVPIVLDPQEHVDQIVRGLCGQEAAPHIQRQLLVIDRLARRFAHRRHYLAVRVQSSRRRKHLAFVLLGRGEDRADVFAAVVDGVDERQLGLGLDEVRDGVGAVARRTRSHEVPEVLHEAPRGEEGALHWLSADVVFDLRFHVEMGQLLEFAAGHLAPVRQRAEDEVPHSCRHGGVRHGFPLGEFPLFQFGVVDGGRDAEDGVRSVHGLLEGFLVVRVGLDDFDTLLLQRLSGGLGEVAGDAADFELLG